METRVRALLLACAVLALAVSADVAAQAPVRFTRPAPELALYGSDELEVAPGEWRSFRFLLVNEGNVTEALRFGIAIALAGPSDPPPLAARVAPAQAQLAPNESIELTVEVGAFPDANATDVQIVLDVSGELGLPMRQQPLTIHVVAAPADASIPAARAVALLGAGGALALAWAAWRLEFARYAMLGAVAPLYSRLARSQVLDQEKRDAIYRLIADDPGVHFSALLRKSALGNGVLVHHLRTLERHGLIVSRREGTLRCFAPSVASFPPPQPRPLTAMQARVLGLVTARAMTQREIAEALGLTQQGANRHVKALERRGLLRIEYADGTWRCHAVAPADPHNAPSPIST